MIHTFTTWRKAIDFCNENKHPQDTLKFDRSTGLFWIDLNEASPRDLANARLNLTKIKRPILKIAMEAVVKLLKHRCVEFGELTGLPQGVCSRCGKPTRFYDWDRNVLKFEAS